MISFVITVGYCLGYFVVLYLLSLIFSKAKTGDQAIGEAFLFLLFLLIVEILIIILRLTGVF